MKAEAWLPGLAALLCTWSHPASSILPMGDQNADCLAPMYFFSITSWLRSLTSTPCGTSASHRSFCASNRVLHFFCDIFPLLKLSCSNTGLNALMVHTEEALVVNGALVFILLSCVAIVSAVIKVPLPEGKRKAFSTAGFHLAVVAVFYGTIIWDYFQPSCSFSAEKDALAAVMCTLVCTPMLNPSIFYTLRDDESKGTLTNAISWTVASLGT